MKTAREVAHEFAACHDDANGTTIPHWGECNAATAAIEARDRELTEALAHVLMCSGTASDCEDCAAAAVLAHPKGPAK
jgi:bisphosphoglycerate-independent phosphoglycerate mutase (AlkP superfamily)